MKGRGAARSATGPMIFTGPSAPRTVFFGQTAETYGASREARSLPLDERGPPVRVDRVFLSRPSRTGLRSRRRAPIPSHVTTPRERAPRVDGSRWRVYRHIVLVKPYILCEPPNETAIIGAPPRPRLTV